MESLLGNDPFALISQLLTVCILPLAKTHRRICILGIAPINHIVARLSRWFKAVLFNSAVAVLAIELLEPAALLASDACP